MQHNPTAAVGIAQYMQHSPTAAVGIAQYMQHSPTAAVGIHLLGQANTRLLFLEANYSLPM
jgi:hypothetical protein